jgi:hypothetical protein
MQGVVETFVNHTLSLTPAKDKYETIGTTEIIFVTVEPKYVIREGKFTKVTRTRNHRLHFTHETLLGMAQMFADLADAHKRLLGSETRPEGTVAVEDIVDAEQAATEEKPNPPGWTEIEPT